MKCLFPRKYTLPDGGSMMGPCRLCHACRINKATEWAIRIEDEINSSKQPVATFLTLTYNEDSLPTDATLKKESLQKFHKRLKIDNLRYFAIGEYGDKTKRPHYHGIYMGQDWTDNKSIVWLQKKWPYGHIMAKKANVHSILYVTKYILKKVIGQMTPDQEDRYIISKDTGECREREFAIMSRRPGIGKEFAILNRIYYTEDMVHYHNRTVGLPQYYKMLKAIKSPELTVQIRERILTRQKELEIELINRAKTSGQRKTERMIEEFEQQTKNLSTGKKRLL